MIIHNATLPPKVGYVEVEENGIRVYKKVETSESKSIEALQTENELLKAQLQAATDRADFIEDCIAEMAMVVYSV